MKIASMLVAVVASLSSTASAQSLSRWTAELTIGAGAHTNRAGESWFYDDLAGQLRVGLAYRVQSGATRAAYAKLDYVTEPLSGDFLICRITPNGGCYSHFHPGPGGSVALGVRQMVGQPLVVGAALGMGKYGDGTTSGGIRPYVEGDIALRVIPHFAIVATARYLRWSSDGAPYWFAPLMGGIRVY
jgi:hypothetical protein